MKRKKTTKPPTEGELRERYQVGMKLLTNHAQRVWRQYASIIELDELVSVGLQVLLRAVTKYDPERSHFAPYLTQRFEWAMRSEIRKRARRSLERSRGLPLGVAERLDSKVPRKVEVTQSDNGTKRSTSLFEQRSQGRLGSILLGGDLSGVAIDGGLDPEAELMRADVRRLLREALRKLPPARKHVLTERYYRDRRLTEVAIDLDLSVATVSRIHRAAIVQLADALRRAGYVDDKRRLNRDEPSSEEP